MKKIFLILLLFIIGNFAFCVEMSVCRLKNGHTIIVKNVPDNPIVTIDTWVNIGSANENDKTRGVSHFLEHMLFKGTVKYPSGTADKILESKGAIINAATSYDYTHFYITIPSNSFETAMDIHSDMLLNPQMPRKELEKERKVVLEEIAKNEDNPKDKLYFNLIQNLYKTHPYKQKVIGKKEVIEIITREEMLDYYNKFYTPENMTTIIIGDVKPQRAFETAKKYFETNPRVNTKIVKTKPDLKINAQITKIDKEKIENAYLLMGYKTVSAKEKKESAALDVLATILGDGKSSRLYNTINSQKHLSYSITSAHQTLKQDGIFYVNADFIPDNYEKLKENIFIEIKKLQNENISQDELQKAKNIIERDLQYARESNANQASEIGYSKTVYEDVNYYYNYLNDIKSITTKDLKRVAQKYLKPEYCVISVIFPENYSNISSTTIKNEKIGYKAIETAKNTTKYLYDNGLNLIICENKSNDIVAISIIIKGGSFIEQKAGTASILASALFKGTTNYPMEEFNKILEQKGIQINASSNNDYFKITLKTTKNELTTALEMLNEIVNHAKLETYQIEKVKSDKLNAIKNAKDNPFNVAVENLKGNIWAKTPYGNSIFVLEKSIPTISQNDVLNYYKNLFTPKNIIISSNGNTDNQLLLEKIGKIFNSKSEQKINLKDYRILFKPFSAKKDIIIKKDVNASWITLGYLTSGTNNLKDYAVLNLIDTILGSGLSSRLFSDLREQKGLAYTVGTSYLANFNQGIFVFYIGTNKKNIKQATEGINAQIELLKREFISNKELKEAKEQIIGNYSIMLETNMAKASNLAFNELINQNLNFQEKYFQMINSITQNDVIEIANKYFRDDSQMWVTVTP